MESLGRCENDGVRRRLRRKINEKKQYYPSVNYYNIKVLSIMRTLTLEEFCNFLTIMTIEHSVGDGPTITHFGHVAGVRTLAISTCRGEGGGFVYQ
jgi:hypothetical protein